MGNLDFQVSSDIPDQIKKITDIHLSALINAISDISPINRVETIDKKHLQADRQIITAIGKNAAVYAHGLEQKIEPKPQKVIVFQAEGYTDVDIPQHWDCYILPHPRPNEETFERTANYLNYLDNLEQDILIQFIVTGGGSSCFALPEDDISKSQYDSIIQRAMSSGFNIYELNYIRSLIDKVKGGKLITHVPNHQVKTWAVSDVLNDDPKIIGSGPTVPGISHDPEISSWLKRTLLNLDVSVTVENLQQKIDDAHSIYIKYLDNFLAKILTTRSDLLSAIEKYLIEDGYDPMIADASLGGSVEDAADQMYQLMERFSYQSERVILWAGEPTITLTSEAIETGQGGRISALCCLMAEKLKNHDNLLFYGIATDGVDGSSPSSGYIVTNQTANDLKPLGGAKNLVRKGDSGVALTSLGYGITIDNTDINLSDLYIGFIL